MIKDKVSVIIPTYNRYNALIKAIESVEKQTYQNIEIIVINDCSTDKEYETKISGTNIVWIDLTINSKQKLGFSSPGYVRNKGIKISTGEYIAILDDDDYWFPEKLSKQLELMKSRNIHFCSSEALIGNGLYVKQNKYLRYNADFFLSSRIRYSKKNGFKWKGGIMPIILIKDYVRKKNLLIHSSIIVSKEILSDVGYYKEIDIKGSRNNKGKLVFEDFDLIKRIFEKSNCIYIKTPLLYYDGRLSKTGDKIKYFKIKLKKIIHQ